MYEWMHLGHSVPDKNFALYIWLVEAVKIASKQSKLWLLNISAREGVSWTILIRDSLQEYDSLDSTVDPKYSDVI
jgi:hypothetical protein